MATDSEVLLSALQKPSYKEVTDCCLAIADFGPFVWKNVSTALALSPQAQHHVSVFPWVAEITSLEVLETWVGAGTNGSASARLAQQGASSNILFDCRGVKNTPRGPLIYYLVLFKT